MTKASRDKIIFAVLIFVISFGLTFYFLDKQINTRPLGPVSAVATIYEKDSATGEFNVWNGPAFGQANPFIVTNGLSAVLAKGEYYARVDAEGYNSVNSLITRVDRQSIVTADINLEKKDLIFYKKIKLLFSKGRYNNFPLNVAPLPEESPFELGHVLPEIKAYDKYGEEIVFLRTLGDRPNVVFVFNYWSTEAQEQLDIYEQVLAELEGGYNFISLTTMEPANINESYVGRGEYGIEIYKPELQFFADYQITSLPQFYITNLKGELIGTITGSYSAEDLIKLIKDMSATE